LARSHHAAEPDDLADDDVQAELDSLIERPREIHVPPIYWRWLNPEANTRDAWIALSEDSKDGQTFLCKGRRLPNIPKLADKAAWAAAKQKDKDDPADNLRALKELLVAHR